MDNKYKEKDELLFAAVMWLQQGKEDMFTQVYELSEKYIYKIIYDIVKSTETTQDLMQETYIQIYNKINTLEDPRAFYKWAGRIATNKTLRYIQSGYGKNESLVVQDEEGNIDYPFETASADHEEFIPESILMDQAKVELLAGIVDALTPEQKLCVQYYYYEEMSVGQIAREFGCSEGTIKSRLNYARKAIKDAVLKLEKEQGTRLYSISGLPIFWLLFRQEAEKISVPIAAAVKGFLLGFIRGGAGMAATAEATLGVAGALGGGETASIGMVGALGAGESSSIGAVGALGAGESSSIGAVGALGTGESSSLGAAGALGSSGATASSTTASAGTTSKATGVVAKEVTKKATKKAAKKATKEVTKKSVITKIMGTTAGKVCTGVAAATVITVGGVNVANRLNGPAQDINMEGQETSDAYEEVAEPTQITTMESKEGTVKIQIRRGIFHDKTVYADWFDKEDDYNIERLSVRIEDENGKKLYVGSAEEQDSTAMNSLAPKLDDNLAQFYTAYDEFGVQCLKERFSEVMTKRFPEINSVEELLDEDHIVRVEVDKGSLTNTYVIDGKEYNIDIASAELEFCNAMSVSLCPYAAENIGVYVLPSNNGLYEPDGYTTDGYDMTLYGTVTYEEEVTKWVDADGNEVAAPETSEGTPVVVDSTEPSDDTSSDDEAFINSHSYVLEKKNGTWKTIKTDENVGEDWKGVGISGPDMNEAVGIEYKGDAYYVIEEYMDITPTSEWVKEGYVIDRLEPVLSNKENGIYKLSYTEVFGDEVVCFINVLPPFVESREEYQSTGDINLIRKEWGEWLFKNDVIAFDSLDILINDSHILVGLDPVWPEWMYE